MLNFLAPILHLSKIETLGLNEQVAILAALVLIVMTLILLIQACGINILIKKLKLEDKKTPVNNTVKEEKSPELNEEVRTVSFKERLKQGLGRSRSEVWDKLSGVISGKKIDDDIIEELEEILYSADIGPETVSELLCSLKKEASGKDYEASDFKNFLFNFLGNLMRPIQAKVDNSLYTFNSENRGKTKTIMVVGVNGAGKTTTIGKLATRLKNQGANVVVGACDTFRAAAVDQLQVWCDRAGAKMIRAKEGTNPSGVAYEALDFALKEKADYCILDTAGRLHTKGNLMDELQKNKRVLKKLDEHAPHQTLLVLDAITGQNAIKQAEEFHKTLDISGMIFTKCDGSSKAGSAISITKKLQVPISYIGVGESVEDLDIFSLDDYLKALLGI